MKQHIRLYSHNGYWWLGFEHARKIHLITRLGRIGDCIQP